MLSNVQEVFSESLNKVLQRHFRRSEFCEKYIDAFYSVLYSENTIWTGSEVENEVVRERGREERL